MLRQPTKKPRKTFVSYSQILLLHLCKSIGCFQKKGRYIFTSVARENQVNLGFVSNCLRQFSAAIAPLQCTITLYNRDENLKHYEL